ncbi:MAG: DUF2304 domain-containing protein [Candidatus Omnitrophica bacterium]|nr:DUF2304 domain-containing protein [Candidatus Omnitrophota bacterium]
MQAKPFAIVIALFVFLGVILLIRRHRMTLKYALFWLCTSTMVLFLAINDGLLFWFKDLFGFVLASNFIFFLSTVFLVVLSLMLTVYVNQQNDRAEILAQKVGILEHEIKELKRK